MIYEELPHCAIKTEIFNVREHDVKYEYVDKSLSKYMTCYHSPRPLSIVLHRYLYVKIKGMERILNFNIYGIETIKTIVKKRTLPIHIYSRS